jgi:hypothetical protein
MIYCLVEGWRCDVSKGMLGDWCLCLLGARDPPTIFAVRAAGGVTYQRRSRIRWLKKESSVDANGICAE